MKRMAASAATFAATLFAVGLVWAADKPDLAPAFKNTIVSTYPDGREARLWLDADGAYRAEGRRRDASDGRWTLRGSDTICLKQAHPRPPLPIAYCTALPSGGVGASWSARSVLGEPLKVKLAAGR